MKVSPRSVGLVALGLAVGITLGGVGVATATSGAGGGTKACATTKGVLVLPSAKGKCPRKTKHVVLGAKGPAGPPGTSYLLSGSGSLSITEDGCDTGNFAVEGLEVGDTALVVPDYGNDNFPAQVMLAPGVVQTAGVLPVTACNQGPAVSLPDKTFYFWRVAK